MKCPLCGVERETHACSNILDAPSLLPDGKGSKSPMFLQRSPLMNEREFRAAAYVAGVPLGVDANRKGGSW